MKNKLILGTVQLGLNYGINNKLGKPSLQNAFEILNLAYNEGLKTLDTAEGYGDSQEIIGKFLKVHTEKSFNIITKLSANHNLKKGELLNHIEKNCEILGTNQLCGYMFHNFQSLKKDAGFYDEMLIAKAKGLVKKVGISLYTNDELEEILSSYSGFELIQIPFNVFDNASKRKNLLIRAKKKNIEVHTRSTFLQGLFFKNKNTIPEKLKPLLPYIENLESIKNKNKINIEELALQYVLQKNYIDNVLIGVESLDQLRNNINISNQKLNIPHDKIDSIHVLEENLLNPSNWH